MSCGRCGGRVLRDDRREEAGLEEVERAQLLRVLRQGGREEQLLEPVSGWARERLRHQRHGRSRRSSSARPGHGALQVVQPIVMTLIHDPE